MGYSGFPNNGVMPMHGPSLAETTAFVAVVELKSFTKAAKQLALSPPRVSEMVRNLEDRLGVRLVERTTRSVAASAAGERLLARLRPVLEEYQAALESTNEFRGKPAGTLRLTAPQPAADFFLASAIPRFLAQYSEISLDLSVSDTLTDIVAERFDAGIRLCRSSSPVRRLISSNGANPRRQTILSGTIACGSDFQAAPTCPGAFASNAATSKSTSRVGSASIRWPSLDRPLSKASRWCRRRQSSLRGISQHAGLRLFSTSGRQLRRQDFFFIIRAVAKCGRRSRPWWIFCARSAAARPREPRNESTRDRNWEWITGSRAGMSLIGMKLTH